jgi:hypothetical protein
MSTWSSTAPNTLDAEQRERLRSFGLSHLTTDEYFDHADEQARNDRSGFGLVLFQLLTLTDRHSLVNQMNSLDDNACCNAARQLYRGASVAVSDLVSEALCIRYHGLRNSEQAAPYALELKWDWQTKHWVPAPGSTWSDLDFSHGPHLADPGKWDK